MKRLWMSWAATTMLAVAMPVVAAEPLAGASPDVSPSPPPAGSSSPSTARSPSPPPVDCGTSTALLPPAIDGQPITATITSGVAAIDPDDLLDPMLAALARSRTDVCVVVFRYGDADDALTGQLVRIADTHASDLVGRFVATLRGAIVAQGGTASPSVLDLDGQTVWSLDVVADGRDSRVLAWQLGDAIVLTSGMAAMERLVRAAQDPGTPAASSAVLTPPG